MKQVHIFGLISMVCLGLTSISQSADRYWIGVSSGNWNNTNNWSTTSDGAGGASVPTAGDQVIIDGGAGTRDGDVHVDISVNVGTITITNTYSGVFYSNSFLITLSNSFLQSTGTVSLGTSTLEVQRHFTRSGGNFDVGLSTIRFTGSNLQLLTPGPTDFHSIEINKVGNSVELQEPLFLTGNMKISAGTLDTSPSSHEINLFGSWENFGNFISQQSTVTFEPSIDSTLHGDTTFYGFRSILAGTTLYFNENSSTTIAGMLDLQNLSLKSTNPGVHWRFHYLGSSITVMNVQVQDSNAGGGTQIVANVGSVDYGNNINWAFNHLPPSSPMITTINAIDMTMTYGAVASEQGYLLEASQNLSFSPIISSSRTFDGAEAQLTAFGLSPNTSYYLRVGSLWNDGTTVYATQQSTYTAAVMPQTVVSTWTAVETSSLTMNWASGGNPGGTVYDAHLSTASNFTGMVYMATTTSTTILFMGLSSDTTYYGRVQAFNNVMIPSPFLNVGSTHTQVANQPAPITPFIAGTNPFDITVGYGTVGSERGYLLEGSTNSSFALPLHSSMTMSGGESPLTITGLMSNTSYYVRVGSLWNDGTTNYAVGLGTYTSANIPGTVASTWTAVEASSLTMNWANGGNPLGTIFDAHVSTANDFTGMVFMASTTNLNMFFVGLSSDTTYYGRVQAIGVNSFASPFQSLGSTRTLPINQPPPNSLNVVNVNVIDISVGYGTVGSEQGYLLEASQNVSFSPVVSSSRTFDGSESPLTVFGLSPNTSYYLRVGSLWNDGTTNYAAPQSTYTLAAMPQSTISTWTAVEFSSLTMNWAGGGNPGGTIFDAHLSTASNFTGMVHVASTPGVSILFMGLNPGTTYYGRVQAFNGNMIPSSFHLLGSTGTQVAIQPPPSSPNITIVNEMDLGMNYGIVGSEQGYLLEASRHLTFNPIVSSSRTLSGTEPQLTTFGLTPNTSYHLRVGSLWNDGTTVYSAPRSTYTLASIPVTVISTWTAVSSESVTMHWGTGANPAGTIFDAHVSSMSNFSGVVHTSSTFGLVMTFNMLLPDTTYYGRVQAFNGSMIPSAFYLAGGTRTFMAPGNPPPTSPVILGATPNDITMNYGTVSSERGYLLEASSTAVAVPPLYSSSTIDGNHSPLTVMGLIPNTTYHLRVGSLWNDGTTTYAASISTPTHAVMPQGVGSTWTVHITSLTMNWASGGNPVGTEFDAELSTASNFTGVVHVNPTQNLFMDFTGLDPDTTYYGRVRAVGHNDIDSPLLIMGSTKTNVNPGEPFLNPMSNSVSTDSFNVTWMNVGVNYNVVLSSNAGFTQIISSGVMTGPATSYMNLMPGFNYHFQVKRATAPNGDYESISVLTFSTGAVPTPNFSFVGFDVIHVNWNDVGGNNYVAALSTMSNFAIVYDSATVPVTNRNFTGLFPDTTYYFKVKIATATDSDYSVVIATRTEMGGADYALNFDGADKIARVPHNAFFNFNTDTTLEFWFKRNTHSGSIEHLVGKENGPFTTGWAVAIQNNGSIRFQAMGGPGLQTSALITDSQWHHVAITRRISDGQTKIYLDGVQDGQAFLSVMNINAERLKFGNSNGLVDDFNGVLDEVRIWNTVRTFSEIQGSRFDHLIGNEPNLQAYFDLNEGAGINFSDITANSFVGDLGLLPTFDVANEPVWISTPIPGFGAPVDNATPTVSIRLPLDQSSPTVAGLTLISGTSQDNQSVKRVDITIQRQTDSMYWHSNGMGGGYWAAAQTFHPVGPVNNWIFPGHEVDWSTGTTYQMIAIAEDFGFNIAVDTSTFYIDVSTDIVPPNVQIQYPVNGSTYSATQLTLLSGTASDNEAIAIVGIELTRLSDNYMWDQFAGGGGSWVAGHAGNPAVGFSSWTYAIPSSAWVSSGSYRLNVLAKDLADLEGVDSSTFTLNLSTNSADDTIPPQVFIVHPASGSVHAPASLFSLDGTASDNIAVVETSVKIKNVATGLHWDGVGFNSAASIYHFLINPTNWSYGGVSSSAWVNGSTYTLVARSKDGAGNFGIATSDFLIDISNTGDTIPPFVNVFTPISGGVYAPDAVVFNGSAGDNVTLAAVDFRLQRLDTGNYFDGVGFTSPGIQYHPAIPPFSAWTINISSLAFSNANYDLVVVATDSAGLTSSISVPFTVSGASAVVDAVSPTISISFPVNGVNYTDSTQLHFSSGTANDNLQLIEVALSIQDDTGNYFNGFSWTSPTEIWGPVFGDLYNWNEPFPIFAWKNGNFTMRARAVDGALNVTYSSISFTVSGSSGTGNADSQAPNSFIYNPIPGSIQGPHAFTHLNGHADDPFGVQEVVLSLYEMNTSFYWAGSGFTSPSEVLLTPSISFSDAYVLDWFMDIPVSAYQNGSYVLTVYAKDPSGNTNTQTSTFTVVGAGGGAGDLTPPSITIQNPADGGTFNESQMVVFSGTATDNVGLDEIEIKILQDSSGFYWDGGQWVATEQWLKANGLANWTFNTPISMWTNGDYTISAEAEDTAGNTSQVTHNVTVSTTGAGGTPPTVLIQFPVNSNVYVSSGITILSGTANDDGTVTSVRLRITDLNMNWDWNPFNFIWEPGHFWFDATLSGNVWTSTNIPPLGPGHYRLMAEASDNSALVSIAQAVEFFIEIPGGGGGGDFTAPAQITTLAAAPGSSLGSVNLSWTAVGDDALTGTAHAYTIKYRPGSPIVTETDWIDSQDISVPPINQNPSIPRVAGSTEGMTVNNLIPGLAYFWAVRVRDEVGNRSPISNSPLATAFGGCTGGTGDGEGSASVSPMSFQELELATATLTYTVGTSGITSDGKILVKIPDGWLFPQTNFAGMPGYITASASNGSVSISTFTQGPTVTISVLSGTLNAGDTITLTYLASPACGVQTGVRFDVLSQASNCGVLTPINSQPTVNVTAGPATWVSFDSFQKFVQTGVAKLFNVQGQNSCGSVATVAGDVNITASVVRWDSGTNQWASDSNAILSLSASMSPSFASQIVVLSTGQSALPLYYQLNSAVEPDNHFVRIVYTDIVNSSFQSENILQMIPNSNASGFSNVSVDLGTPGGALTTVSITPNNDGTNDFAFINFQTGNQTLPYNIQISNDGFSTILWERGGVGSPAREVWDGRRGTPPYDTLPNGSYNVRLIAGGAQDNTLSISISATGLSGTVQDSSSTALSNAFVDVFGPIQRHTQTASDGTFNLVGLPNGTYRLEIFKEGYSRYVNTSVPVSGNTNVGTITLDAEARVVLDISRTDTSFEEYGAMIGNDGTQQFFATVHFAQGRSVPDDGFNSANLPTLFLKPGVSHSVSLDFPGLSVTPLTGLSLTPGQIYTWQPTLTENSKIAGTVRLPNGANNTIGVNVDIAIGLDANPVDGQFDLGYPSFFTNTFIPPYETQANYATPGLADGTYVVEVHAPGFAPQSNSATLSGSDADLDFTLSQGGTADLTFNFNATTTALDKGDGTFDVILRISGSNGFFTTDVANLNVSGSAISQLVQFTGVPDGTYTILPEPVTGFGFSSGNSNVLTVTGGTGALTLAFAAYSGSLLGTVTLPGASTMNDLVIQLIKGTTILTSPVLSGNTFTFSGLEAGRYDLSVVDNNSNATFVRSVLINNGGQTAVNVNLAGQTTYSISGTVNTVASPPYNTLSAINADSSSLTIYTASGTQSLPALRVEAYLVKPNGTTAPLPTTAGQVLNPAEIRFGNINVSDGSYSINGLQSGRNYRIRLNSDMDADGAPDIPLEERRLTLFSNQTGVNFTIRDGASISGTLVVASTENGRNLNVILTDADLKKDIITSSVYLSGTSASFEFLNLRVGRYLVRVVDADTPQKYSVAPQFVAIENSSDQKTLTFELSQSAIIQLRLALESGELITSGNVSSLLPTGFKIRFVGPGDIQSVSTPNTNNRWKVGVLPNKDYEIIIEPPATQQESDEGKGFLPVVLQGRAAAGQVDDKGTIVLRKGTDVTLTVQDSQGNGIENIPVLIFQSLARSLEPRVVISDSQGQVIVEDMPPQVRFFDFVANSLSYADRLPEWSERARNLIDITKPADIANLTITLQSVTGSISGQITSSNSSNLIAAYGTNKGEAGVSIIAKRKGTQKILEFVSDGNGAYSIPLPEGIYDLEFLAQNHIPHFLARVNVGSSAQVLDAISLTAGGVKLEGTIREANGSLPSQQKVAQLLAFDSNGVLFRAHRELESITSGVDRYVFHGLTAGVFDVVAIDDVGRLTVLSDDFSLPNQNTTLNLTFQIPRPTLVASFIQKLPAGVEAVFSSNQAFRNRSDDLDGDGTADDSEFDNFTDSTRAPYVGVVSGNGSLAFDSVSADRKQAQYTYSLVNDPTSITLTATFNTKEVNPQTGIHYQVSGNFTYPVGLKAQQRDTVTQLGKDFVLPGGAEFSLQQGWHPDAGTGGFEVGFEEADLPTDFAGASGLGAMQLAQQLGAAAYRPRMYRAIETLAAAPEVNAFSSFYDIFLPASVSRVFTNTPTLTLKYDCTVQDPSTLNIYFFNETQGIYTLENNDRQIDTENCTISVSLNHASVFTVLASSAPIIRGDANTGGLNVFNFPNPFDLNQKTVQLQDNSSAPSQTTTGTMIKISLPANISGAIEVQIFNVAGEKITTLRENAPTGGAHYYLNWNGLNSGGKKVASGVYFGMLKVGGQTKFFKMAVVK